MILTLMINYALAANPVKCPEVALENLSSEPWTPKDAQVFEHLLKNHQCKERYKHSPCMTKFTKRDVQTYHISCGPALR
jgi:hypothetical protein